MYGAAENWEMFTMNFGSTLDKWYIWTRTAFITMIFKNAPSNGAI